MRTIKAFTLSVLALVVLSTQASAYAVELGTVYAGEGLDLSDTVIVDVFLDAVPAGLIFFSVAVLYPNNGDLVYDGPASAALPPQGPGTSGAQPSYILYTGGKGSTVLYPQQVPSWRNWPAPPAGKRQVNINYIEPTFTPASASGTGIYVGTLVFEVASMLNPTANIELCNTCGGNITENGNGIIPPSAIPLVNSPIVVNLPEPALATLALAGLATLYLVRRRA